MPTVLSKKNSLFNQFLSELRDVELQKDRSRFRKNMERIGELFAYEISSQLLWRETEITTPLGIATVPVLAEQPVLATILRAGLPLHQGLLNYFDRADCAYISAYRKAKKNGDFEIKIEYVSTPVMEGRTLIIADPMLATGQSMVLSCKELTGRANIKDIHIVAAIASVEGIEYVKRNLPKAKLWLGAVDAELTTRSFIVPGLGDAGDLAFGEKL